LFLIIATTSATTSGYTEWHMCYFTYAQNLMKKRMSFVLSYA